MSETGRDLLTQEEIDALLAEIDAGSAAPALDPGEEAALAELLGAVVSAAAPLLGVDAAAGGVPDLAVVPAGEAGEALAGDAVLVALREPVAVAFTLAPAAPAGEQPAEAALEAAAQAIRGALGTVVGKPVALELARRPAGDPAAPGEAGADGPVVIARWGGEGPAAAAALAGLRALLEQAEEEVEAPPPAPARVPAPADYPELDGTDERATRAAIELLFDVPLEVTAVLGRTRRQVGEVLALGPGSVVELDKLAGEPVELLVNGKLIARGEVVVIDEHFGIRITDIVSRAERLKQLR